MQDEFRGMAVAVYSGMDLGGHYKERQNVKAGEENWALDILVFLRVSLKKRMIIL